MSSDDHCIIRIHPKGGYAVTHLIGDRIEEELPAVSDRAYKCLTLQQAFIFAWGLQPEYGVNISEDVWDAEKDRIREEYKQEQREHRKRMKLVKEQDDKARQKRRYDIAMRSSQDNHPSNPRKR